ncbi:GMP synthase (glutamine-hydrolysing) [Paracoccus versutus]|uniref:GMP synthase (Glutamine-hydrolysing) n=1 Tax=Paracoccus versutus TaxID=34007 RepID=A0A3D9XF32_PARVE|nr:hypothetical protein [Paracoccus versutus]REF69024.1 GMP synthase (glutamine-hydrolysing) [Paracoccus versutus]
MKSALILRHLAFEDLGSFAPVLRDAGYQLQDVEAAVDPLPDPLEPDLVVVLGGPIGVNDGAAYPCMTEERNWLAMRLAADRPTLGICLGAQLMAAVLGARVAPIAEKEIGFAPLTLTAPGRAGPLAHLSNIPVLHWHGEGLRPARRNRAPRRDPRLRNTGIRPGAATFSACNSTPRPGCCRISNAG